MDGEYSGYFMDVLAHFPYTGGVFLITSRRVHIPAIHALAGLLTR